MIAMLRGKLDSHRDDSAVIDVGGVGYLVFASARTLAQIGGSGANVVLHIETHVREDNIRLYGFVSEEERHCFQMLQSVQGVGAKAAMAILSALAPLEVMQAVAAQDRVPLTRANGVGPRIATRIVNELKDKAVSWSLGAQAGDTPAGAPAGAAAGRMAEDAISALVNLGYNRSDAHGVVAGAMQQLGQDAPLDRLIATALRGLAS